MTFTLVNALTVVTVSSVMEHTIHDGYGEERKGERG